MSVSPRATTGALAVNRDARPTGLAVRLRTSKDLPGVILVAPYLAYMRQDKAFRDAEAPSKSSKILWSGSLRER